MATIPKTEHTAHTAQKMKFSIKDFFNRCDQIRKKLWIWSYLLKKSLMEKFIFCAVTGFYYKTQAHTDALQIRKLELK